MIKAGVRNVRDRLSEYLRRVREGERVVITDRGRPVAVLTGVEESEATEVAWELVQQGVGTWQGGKPAGLDDPPRVPGHRASDAVLEDRR